MHPVALYCFGPLRLEIDGVLVETDTRKALALLAYLALGGGSHNRDTLAVLLYPESSQSSARSALRRTLSTLRKALQPGMLQTSNDLVSLQPGSLWVDVLAFRQNLAACAAHPNPQDPACLAILRQAVSLYRAGFMAGFTLRDSPQFDEWQFFQAEDLRQSLAGALSKLAGALAVQGEYPEALEHARRWLANDPLNEEAHRLLMQIYAWSGQRNAALRQYRECVRTLAQELGVDPLEETTRLYQSILENHPPAPPAPPVPPVAAAAPPPAPLNPTQAGPPPLAASRERLPLVGRSAELSALLEAYQTRAADGYLYGLEGEAGIGKTRLAAEFLTTVRAAGAAVLHGRCYSGESGLAYAPFLDALGPLLAHPTDNQLLARLPAPALAAAAQLLPALAARYPAALSPPEPVSPGAQLHFYQGLLQAFEGLLAAPAPGILFLDDLHWSDTASLDLLAFLARRLRGAFILVTWCSTETPDDHPLPHLFARLERDGRAARTSLPRLSPSGVAEMVNLLAPGHQAGFASRLYAETEGNPFFVLEYLGTLTGQDNPASPDWVLPAGVRHLLRSRLAGVGDLGIQLLGTAAALGRSFDFELVQAVSGRSELEVVAGLETLVGHGLLNEQSAGQAPAPVYDFTHDKIRQVVYNETSLARRRLLHQRAGDTLAARARHHPDPASLAGAIGHHYTLAGQNQLAAAYEKQAGDHARSLYANHDALAHYTNALASGFDPPGLLHEAIADLYMLLGQYLPALAACEAAASLCPPEHQPWLEHKIGNIHHQIGQWDLAESHFQVALDALGETGDMVEQARIHADWSRTALRRGDAPRAGQLAAAALQLAQAGRNQPAIGQAYNILGILARARGDYETAIHLLRQSLEIAQAIHDPFARMAALNNLAHACAGVDDYDQAVSLAAQALELALQTGDRHSAAALHNHLADLYHALEQPEAAMQHLMKAVVIFTEIGAQAGETHPQIWMLEEW